MEQRSETTRETERRREERTDTSTPGLSHSPEKHTDERDPVHAQTDELRTTSRQKGEGTGSRG